MGANEALHIATDHLHMFAYIAGFSDTMSRLSSVPLDTNIATNGELKDGAALDETVKPLWRGIGTGHRRPIHLREPSAHSARCSTRPVSSMYVYFDSPGTTHEWVALRRNLIDLASSPSSQIRDAHSKNPAIVSFSLTLSSIHE